MPNSIQHAEGTIANALKVGDMHIGAGGDKGPTSSTGFFNGINPPIGGYTVYQNKSGDEGPSIMCPANDADLITMSNTIAGGNDFTTINDCFTYFAGQSDKMVMNHTTNKVVTDSLKLYLDAAQVISYPQSGTSWVDLSSNGKNGVLQNSPTFNSSGYLEFDGTNDYVSVAGVGISDYSQAFSMGIWFKIASEATWDNGFRSNIFSIAGSYAGQYGLFKNDSDDFGVQLRDSNSTIYATCSGNVKDQWYHLIATWDGSSTLKLYRNGELVSTNNTGGITGSPDTTNLHIAGERAFGGAQGNVFQGDIANCFYFNKALSDTEVLQTYYGAPNIPNNGKIQLNRAQNGVTVESARGWEFDLAQEYSPLQTYGYASSALNGDFDGLTNFTYCLWLHCFSHHTNYSQTSFYKYAGTTTAVIRLYDFGNYLGNGDQANNRFYANGDGTWKAISGNFIMNVGDTKFICLQYDSSNGGNLWENGVKISTGMGSGTIATNTSALGIITPEYSGEQYVKVQESYVYTNTLTDQQIIDLYHSTKMKYSNGV